MSKNIIYQMLPRLWGNLNEKPVNGGTLEENGCGKFSNIDKATFEYLKSLNVSHVWYTGIIRHATAETENGCEPSSCQWVKGRAGSPYSITDWFDVNPYLADRPEDRMAEFEDLVRRTHEAGLKVIVDFVPNHVARDYGAFSPKPIVNGRDANGHPVLGANDDISAHWKAENDFFYYPEKELRLPVTRPGEPYREFPAKASGNNYTAEPDVNDWYDTVKLNYCDYHTETWDKMLEVLKFWAGKGVDGFRCDMVELVPHEFFKWAIAELKKEYPEIIFIAEIYEKNLYRKYVREVGFDLLYDKSGLYDSLFAIIRANAGSGTPIEQWQSAERITWNWQMLGDLQPNMLNFLENHDELRVGSAFFGGDAENSFAAFTVSLLMNTAPYMIYFGEEIGERGMDEEGLSGMNGRTTIFDWWSVGSLRKLYLEIHGEKALTDREERILEHKRNVLALASNPAFSAGRTYDLCYCNIGSDGFDRKRHFAFLRSDEKESYLVVCNFSEIDSNIDIHIPEDAFNWLKINRTETPINVSVPAYGSKVIAL